MTQAEFAAYASRPCCNPACGGRWGTGCWHCHHPDFADRSRIDRAILAAVEAWARATGRWNDGKGPIRPAKIPESWMFGPPMLLGGVSVWSPLRKTWRDEDTDIALLAALCIDGSHTLDMGRCERCSQPWFEGDGPAKFGPDWAASCMACAGTRRNIVEIAHLMLAPRADKAREAVEVLATRLQADGSKLGEWLILWLAGRNGCICNTNPDTTDGPDIDCPIHGENGAPPWQPAAIAALVRSAAG